MTDNSKQQIKRLNEDKNGIERRKLRTYCAASLRWSVDQSGIDNRQQQVNQTGKSQDPKEGEPGANYGVNPEDQ